MRDQRNKKRCESCGKDVPEYDTVYLGSEEGESRLLCSRCFNETISASEGLDFQHPNFEPIELRDTEGVPHKFAFQTLFAPAGLTINAHELGPEYPEGYEFEVLGGSECDPLELFRELYERMRRAMGQKHLKQGEQGFAICDHQIVRARIDMDEENEGQTPLLIIDGKRVTWEEFGRMLMTYEGWQMKVEIYDRCEER